MDISGKMKPIADVVDAIIPCIFPLLQGIFSREGFTPDWLLRHLYERGHRPLRKDGKAKEDSNPR
jgi:hypothetical protein